jgi:hypothetical protein
LGQGGHIVADDVGDSVGEIQPFLDRLEDVAAVGQCLLPTLEVSA